MKKIITIFVILLCYFGIQAQVDSTSLSYYPLNDGDYWEYVEVQQDWGYPPMAQTDYYSYKVIGDTLLLQSKRFKMIKRKKLRSTQQPFYYFERIDTITCNVYRYDAFSNTEYLIDSLKSQLGDSCNATRTFNDTSHNTLCTGIISDSILGNLTTTKIFEEKHWHSPIEYKLSKGFGLTYVTYYYDIGTFTKNLLYARIDTAEFGTQVTSIQVQDPQLLRNFHLYQNHPNPFNPITVIPFEISQKSSIEISIFNIIGKKIKTLLNEEINRGNHKITWDGTNQAGELVSSGVYTILLRSKNQTRAKKCLLIK